MKKFALSILIISTVGNAHAQTAVIDSSKYPPLVKNTAQQNQEHMMKQLGIKKLRPGASANESAHNYANYDPAKADPCPQLPDALT